jgi:hypothetical protein
MSHTKTPDNKQLNQRSANDGAITIVRWLPKKSMMIDKKTCADGSYKKRKIQSLNPQFSMWILNSADSVAGFIKTPTVLNGKNIRKWPTETPEATTYNKNKVLSLYSFMIEKYTDALNESIERMRGDDRFDNTDSIERAEDMLETLSEDNLETLQSGYVSDDNDVHDVLEEFKMKAKARKAGKVAH